MSDGRDHLAFTGSETTFAISQPFLEASVLRSEGHSLINEFRKKSGEREKKYISVMHIRGRKEQPSQQQSKQ